MNTGKAKSEDGFTMIITLIAMTVMMMLAVVAVTAVNGDGHLSLRNLEQKQAYEAAKAGVEDYAFHLDATNGSYWEKCTNVELPNAVNQIGSTAKTRPVPGTTGAKYAIELIPSSTQTRYTQCSEIDPSGSMLEQTGQLPGSFRIRSNGFAGKAKATIVATFKRPSFLDYVYFTQFETSDPITYAGEKTWLPEAYKQCEKTMQEGRYAQEIPGSNGVYCNVISFKSGEAIRGPLHSNDAIFVCGNPTFGRSPADSIEVGAPSPGWYGGTNAALGEARLGSRECPRAEPTFPGTFKTSSPPLNPPTTNSELSTIAEPAFRYSGQVRICLSGATMKVSTNGTCDGSKYSGAIPANGVVYVFNNSSCVSSKYDPYKVTYETTSGCGNALVSGENYSGQLTIAAENDVLISGPLTRQSGTNGMLGLIANNFVRVFHAYPTEKYNAEGKVECGSGAGESRLENLEIDAAILAIKHSFIVDHYNCGNDMGSLTVKGAIAQKFRGPVGTFSGSTTVNGYSKNYEYDDRLRYAEPPSFLDPVTKSWVIGRETAG
ncbi:MAG TPA: hypothetical protein VIH47_04315 [Solirubrobacterales bacterium]